MKTVIFACVHNAGRSQMAAAFFAQLADPARARAFGEAGRRRVLDEGFTWSGVAARLEATFRPATDTTPAPTPAAVSVA